MRPRWAAMVAVAAIAASAVSGCTASDNGGVVGGGIGGTAPTGPAGVLRSQLPAAIATRGVLRVAGDLGRAPLLFYGTGTTVPEGIEWELLQAIGRQLGVSVALTDLPMTQLRSAVVAGRADLVISGIVDLKAFESDGLDFVDYLIGSTGVLVRQQDAARITGSADLCGRTVGAVSGTAQQVVVSRLEAACSAAHHPPLAVRLVSAHSAAIALLTGGQVTAVLDDEVVAQYTAQGSTGPTTLAVVGAPFDPLAYGIGVAHTDPQLLTAVRAALRAVIADGEYDQILGRWGGTAAALRTASIDAGQ